MKKIAIILLLVGVLVAPMVAVGQPDVTTPEGWRGHIESPEDIENLLESLIEWIWGIMIIVVVGFLLYAGFLFVTAGGSEEQVGKAKDFVKYALIGIVVMLLAWGAVSLVEAFLQLGQ